MVKKMITFTPNTITYAVPVDSDIGKKIGAKMGIVFHTQYSGRKMDSLSAGFGTVRGIGTSSVFLASAEYKDTSGAFTFTKSELNSFDALIRMVVALSKAKLVLDEMQKTNNDPLQVGFRLKTFFNYYIKNTKGDMAKVKTMQTLLETILKT